MEAARGRAFEAAQEGGWKTTTWIRYCALPHLSPPLGLSSHHHLAFLSAYPPSSTSLCASLTLDPPQITHAITCQMKYISYMTASLTACDGPPTQFHPYHTVPPRCSRSVVVPTFIMRRSSLRAQGVPRF